MANTIDFGIDLGTTNSAITHFHEGEVEVFKNPMGHKETLPSVVAFRKERIIVGDKAREFLEKDPSNVVGSFKRKMGTSEVFTIESIGREINPIELSSYVLKELKNFVYTGEEVASVVVTIPASFDTVQSNATKQAGDMAGFAETVLLQEPIAASLAFVNKSDGQDLKEGQWLVYDLGGGTFDVAIIKIEDGEMTVVDHQGDNYLGGTDFDQLIVEKIVVPKMEEQGTFENLAKELKSASGKYNKLFYELLKKCEELKVSLSSYPSADIEFEIEDDKGELQDFYFSVKREEFEAIIIPQVAGTIDMIRRLLEDNGMTGSDIKEVLMIGGSTYIPCVRSAVKDGLGIDVNFSVDPTTAVAVGAAFFAGTKVRKATEASAESETSAVDLEDLAVKVAYQKTSQMDSEYFAARCEGTLDNRFYRITRSDGGFDTGNKQLTARIEEDLPLVKDSNNSFAFKFYDDHNNLLGLQVPTIEIAHGKYGIMGQPLPADICIEVDDIQEGSTRLEAVFEKNAVLPLKKNIVKEVSKTIRKGSTDGLFINILEGPQHASPASNKPIGTIEISGEQLERDLVKGSDVEITIEMTESRDLKVETYVMMTDQDFENIFSPNARHVNTNKLADELYELLDRIRDEITDKEINEEFEGAEKLKILEDEVYKFYSQAMDLSVDDVTDVKFQLEDKKRAISGEVDKLTKNKKLTKVLSLYFLGKKHCQSIVDEYGDESDKAQLESVLKSEKSMLASSNKMKIEASTEALSRLAFKLNWKRPDYVTELFYYYAINLRDSYKDQEKAAQFIKEGEEAVEAEKYDKVRAMINQLYQLLPPEQKSDIQIKGTGIS